MTDKQRLMLIYNSFCTIDQDENACNHEKHCCECFADYCIENGVTFNRWISVEERMPETSGYYLTCDRKGNVHSLYHNTEQKFPFGIEPWNACYYMPTHWMPAPEPVKED